MVDMPRSCQDAMRTVRSDLAAEPPELNDQDDHVHLLAGDPPKAAVPAPINSLKGVPARERRSQATGRMNRHIMPGHFWSPSSVTGVPRRCTVGHHPAAHRAANNAG